MDILGGLFILLCMAVLIAWQTPLLLAKIEAAIVARRKGIYFMWEQRSAHTEKLQAEAPE
jgi:hypothetical protein